MYAKNETNKNPFLPPVELNRNIQNKKMIVSTLSFLFLALEGVLLSLIYFVLYAWRIHIEFNVSFELFELTNPRFSSYLYFYIIFILIYGVLVLKYRTNSFIASSGLVDEIFKTGKALSFAFLLTVGLSFLFKIVDLSRIVIVSYWLSSILAISILRFIKRRMYLLLNAKNILSKSVIIVGAGKVGCSLIKEFQTHNWLGYNVAGYVDDEMSEMISDVPGLGKISELRTIIEQNILIDELIITIPSERELVHRIISDFRKSPIEIKIIPDMFNLVLGTVQVGQINSLPTVSLVRTPMRGIGYIIKRMSDVLLSSMALIILSPILLLTALCIKVESKGSVIYKQQRVGKNGKVFNMFKFRSMVNDADKMIDTLAKANEVDGIAFKMKNDPRITKVGRFIRKYSIDELPQLFNVLLGNMSLIGPRPPLDIEVAQYGDWEWRRLEVLPGITGLWQVSGRSDLSFQQWVNLDIYYIENWSIALDLKILLKTIPVVLKGEGAY
ncbi:exopolysaccharide biosynthesis polyprenyl glycosylphosphotransferase [Paenibacillus sp. KS1]|uniref:sugar transferase n=1 Tax=Paenibacillus sp. KS1 TaxID=1849249 RepID=UPI0008065C97|nr:sugar transferase [Paenibacillus sp. KS1]OBY76960.1 exopolysaccharide biosynthesis polyprenyl glycosylphosphotransferase [Paenibacillus sp. KS1]